MNDLKNLTDVPGWERLAYVAGFFLLVGILTVASYWRFLFRRKE